MTAIQTGPAFDELLEEWAKIRDMAEPITRALEGAFAVLSEMEIDAGTVAFHCRILNHEFRTALKLLIAAKERSPRAVQAYDGMLAVVETATGYDHLLSAIIPYGS